MRIVVTGSNGFVGNALCASLIEKGHAVRGIVRSELLESVGKEIETVLIDNIGADTNWSHALLGQDVIIHLAAKTHTPNLTGPETEAIFRSLNIEGTVRLAKCAIAHGIKHFIYVSSVKAAGERSGRYPLSESNTPMPEDIYGQTKLEAEQNLQQLACGTGMGLTILRPPLIYGPGVKGNFLKLIELCDSGIPLPFAGIENKRSLIFLGNFTDILIKVLENPNTLGEVFFVSDGENIPVSELIYRITSSLGKKARLFRVPQWLFRILGVALRKESTIEKLTCSLEIENNKLEKTLGWTPPYNMIQGLEITAKWFQSQTHL